MEFHKRLKLLRESKGLNQREFSKKINISPSAYNRIEKGETKPSIDTVISICNNMNISSDRLLGLNYNNQINNDEIEIINIYRKIKDKDQAKKMLEILIKKEPNEVRGKSIYSATS